MTFRKLPARVVVRVFDEQLPRFASSSPSSRPAPATRLDDDDDGVDAAASAVATPPAGTMEDDGEVLTLPVASRFRPLACAEVLAVELDGQSLFFAPPPQQQQQQQQPPPQGHGQQCHGGVDGPPLCDAVVTLPGDDVEADWPLRVQLGPGYKLVRAPPSVRLVAGEVHALDLVARHSWARVELFVVARTGARVKSDPHLARSWATGIDAMRPRLEPADRQARSAAADDASLEAGGVPVEHFDDRVLDGPAATTGAAAAAADMRQRRGAANAHSKRAAAARSAVEVVLAKHGRPCAEIARAAAHADGGERMFRAWHAEVDLPPSAVDVWCVRGVRIKHQTCGVGLVNAIVTWITNPPSYWRHVRGSRIKYQSCDVGLDDAIVTRRTNHPPSSRRHSARRARGF